MPWILVGAAVVVIAVGAVLFFTLGGGGGAGSPNTLAEDAVAALNDRDYEKLNELACESEKESNVDASEVEKGLPPGVTIKWELGEVKESGSEAHANIKITFTGELPGGAEAPKLTGDLVMADESGWCVKDFNPSTG